MIPIALLLRPVDKHAVAVAHRFTGATLAGTHETFRRVSRFLRAAMEGRLP
jgi:hypothetical protein